MSRPSPPSRSKPHRGADPGARRAEPRAAARPASGGARDDRRGDPRRPDERGGPASARDGERRAGDDRRGPGERQGPSRGGHEGRGPRGERGGGWPREGRPRGPALHADAYLVPGERAVTELLRAEPGRVRRLLALPGRCPDVEQLASERQVPVQACTIDELAAVISPELARGVVAVARPPRAWELDELLGLPAKAGARRLLVALDGVQDPHNLGAILRSAEFFGASGVFWARDRSAAVTPSVVRASAGASERLPTGQVTNLARALAACKEAGFWVLGTVADGGADLRKLCQDGLPDALVVVLGSEGSGLRRLTRESCDFLATIPGAGGVASLNVSAAAAVTLSALA